MVPYNERMALTATAPKDVVALSERLIDESLTAFPDPYRGNREGYLACATADLQFVNDSWEGVRGQLHDGLDDFVAVESRFVLGRAEGSPYGQRLDLVVGTLGKLQVVHDANVNLPRLTKDEEKKKINLVAAELVSIEGDDVTLVAMSLRSTARGRGNLFNAVFARYNGDLNVAAQRIGTRRYMWSSAYTFTGRAV